MKTFFFDFKKTSDKLFKAVLEQKYRYHIAQLFDDGGKVDKWAFTNRKPRSDCKYWNEAHYMVWDNQEKVQLHVYNCKVVPEGLKIAYDN